MNHICWICDTNGNKKVISKSYVNHVLLRLLRTIDAWEPFVEICSKVCDREFESLQIVANNKTLLKRNQLSDELTM